MSCCGNGISILFWFTVSYTHLRPSLTTYDFLGAYDHTHQLTFTLESPISDTTHLTCLL